MTPYDPESYRRILKTAAEKNYRCLDFTQQPLPNEKCLYLRHDIDFSLEFAAELAKINSEVGLRGTFFVLLRSHAYNAFSPTSKRYLEQIAACQQWIGLHAFTPPNVEALSRQGLEDEVRADFMALRRLTPNAHPVFAWHNPTPEVVRVSETWTVPGMINAYHPRFTKEIIYRSDSNFRNSVEDLMGVLEAGHSVVQLLFHPLNWIAGGGTMREILAKMWGAVIREAEQEFVTNRTVPGKMPSELIDPFTRAWQGWVADHEGSGS